MLKYLRALSFLSSLLMAADVAEAQVVLRDIVITFTEPSEDPLDLTVNRLIQIGGTCADSGGETRNLRLIIRHNGIPIGSPIEGFQCMANHWSFHLDTSLLPDSVEPQSRLYVAYANNEPDLDPIDNEAFKEYIRNSNPPENHCPVLSVSASPLQGLVGVTYDRDFFLSGVTVSDADDPLSLEDVEISGLSIPYTPTQTGVVQITYSVQDEDSNCLQTAERAFEIGDFLNPSMCAVAPEIVQTTPADCIPLYSENDLKNISQNLSGTYCLMNDIDLTDPHWTPIGAPVRSFERSHYYLVNQPWAFTGRFLGQNHRIRNLAFDRGLSEAAPTRYPSEKTYLGLFGFAQCAVIQDLNLESVNGQGFQFVGSLVGATHRSRIQNVHTQGVSISGRRQFGGIIGSSMRSILEDVSALGYIRGPVTEISPGVSGSWDAGGLAGELRLSQLSNSEFEGAGVSDICLTNPECSDVHAAGFAGGLVGFALDSIVEGSEASASIIGTTAGGLVGLLESQQSAARIYQSRSHGRVGLPENLMLENPNSNRKTGRVGGIVGTAILHTQNINGQTGFSSSQALRIEESFSDATLHGYGFYASGQISMNGGAPASVGGLVGGATGIEILNSYYKGSTIEVSALFGGYQRIAGGLIGILSEATSSTSVRASRVINSYSSTSYLIHDSNLFPEYQEIGGLVGYQFGANQIESSYFDAQLAGLENHQGNDFGEARSTAQMQTQSTFTNWDFQNIWRILPNQTPSFRALALVCRADFNGDGTLSVADLFAFLAAWFSQSPQADFDGSGSIEVGDIFSFLATYFQGC